MSLDADDARDLQKHRARETLLTQYCGTFGLTRRQAFEDFVAHAENDEESPVFAQAAPRRKRARASQAMERA